MTAHSPFPFAYGNLINYPTASGLVLYNPGDITRVPYSQNSFWTFASGDWTNSGFSAVAGTLPTDTKGQTAYYDGTDVNVAFGTSGNLDASGFYGGYGGATSVYNGTSFSTSPIAWSPATPTAAPYPRTKCMSTYVSGLGNAYVFGGYGQRGILPNSQFWSWTHGTGYALVAGALPAWRTDGMFVSDGTRALLGFGNGNGNTMFNDMNSWNGTVWATLNTINAPSVRAGVAAAYEPGAGLYHIWGGYTISNNKPMFEHWTFNFGTLTFANITAGQGSNHPPAMHGAAMAYDTTSSQLLLVGGALSDGTPSNTTYAYSGGASGDWSVL